jgi:hypothetical protein
MIYSFLSLLLVGCSFTAFGYAAVGRLADVAQPMAVSSRYQSVLLQAVYALVKPTLWALLGKVRLAKCDKPTCWQQQWRANRGKQA